MGGFIGASVITLISAFVVSPIYSTRTDGSTVTNKTILNMMKILTMRNEDSLLVEVCLSDPFVFLVLIFVMYSISDPWTVQ